MSTLDEQLKEHQKWKYELERGLDLAKVGYMIFLLRKSKLLADLMLPYVDARGGNDSVIVPTGQ